MRWLLQPLHKRFTINDIESLLSAGDSIAGHGMSSWEVDSCAQGTAGWDG